MIKGFIAQRRARRLFPKEKKEVWYSWEFWDYQYNERKAGRPWKPEDLNLPCDTFLIDIRVRLHHIEVEK